MSKITAQLENFEDLHEWAFRRQQELLMYETLRNTSGIHYPVDIELQLRNLKDAYHKIGLMCVEHGRKSQTYRPIPAGHASLHPDLGTPLSSSELATHARMLQNEPRENNE